MLLAAAVAGFALGAGPAVGAKHHKARLIARKARSHGHVPARSGRPPLVGTLPGSGTTPTTTEPVPTTPAPSCPPALGVTEGNSGMTYYTRLSRTTLCAGTATTVQLRNDGEDDHDLQILDVDRGEIVATWPKTPPGQESSQRLTLRAGTYRLFCTLTDGNGAHDDLGMHAVITVG